MKPTCCLASWGGNHGYDINDSSGYHHSNNNMEAGRRWVVEDVLLDATILEAIIMDYSCSDIVDRMEDMGYTGEEIGVVMADGETIGKIAVQFVSKMDEVWRPLMDESIEEVVG